MEQSSLNNVAEQVDHTKELAELLGNFSELMTAVSKNYEMLKIWETLLNLSSGEVKETITESAGQIGAMVKEQYETAKLNQEIMRKALDQIAAKLREKGQGFAIEGYEERLSVLK